MRDAEIERLLGAYATNTLSEEEREALFAAALEDQELFNALEDEQALRELLEDSGSRHMIADALAEREPVRTVSWFRKPWAWGALACAAAGLAIGFVVLLQPREREFRTELAMAKVDHIAPQPTVAESVKTPAATQVPQSLKKPIARAAGQLAYPSPPTRESQAVRLQPSAPVPPMAVFNGFRAGANTQLQQAQSGIGYTILRRGSDDSFAPLAGSESLNTGDSIMLRVEAPSSGGLQVLEQGANGQWTPLYPATGAVPVMAHQQYTVPDTPILLGAGKHLRLVFLSAPPATALTTGALEALARPKARYAESSSQTGRTKTSVAPGGPQVESVATAIRGVMTTDIILTPRQAPR